MTRLFQAFRGRMHSRAMTTGCSRVLARLRSRDSLVTLVSGSWMPLSRNRHLATQACLTTQVGTGTSTECITSIHRGNSSHMEYCKSMFATSGGKHPDPSTQGPDEYYHGLVAEGMLQEDPHQRLAVKEFDRLWRELQGYTAPAPVPVDDPVALGQKGGGFFSSLFGGGSSSGYKNAGQPRGLYVWGGVGCGKTMLMDMFYDTCGQVERKKRTHFHHFMLGVHARIFDLKKKAEERGAKLNDVLVPLAQQLANEAWLLCFDEFQVTDVADAMIIRRLFELMHGHGVVVIATSNRPPKDLYLNGLQREAFVPFIGFLQDETVVHHLPSPIDYRQVLRDAEAGEVKSSACKTATPGPELIALRKQAGSGKLAMWHQVDQGMSGDAHNVLFDELVDPHHNPVQLKTQVAVLMGRQLKVPRRAQYIAQFTFKDVCAATLGVADYLAICSNFQVVVITDIPYLSVEKRDHARRFVTLIDILYEHRIKVLCTAVDEAENLFVHSESDPTVQTPLPPPSSPSRPSSSSSSSPSSAGTGAAGRKTLDESFRERYKHEDIVFAWDRTMSRLAEMQSSTYLASDPLIPMGI